MTDDYSLICDGLLEEYEQDPNVKNIFESKIDSIEKNNKMSNMNKNRLVDYDDMYEDIKTKSDENGYFSHKKSDRR